jgi:hypothetical protein
MPSQLGRLFAESVASRDAEALRGLLQPTVSFRALTPGGVLQRDDAIAVVDDVILGTWFSPERVITRVLTVDCSEIGPVNRVSYRFEVQLPDGGYTIEQQAYFKSENDRISWLHILCSGFVR